MKQLLLPLLVCGLLGGAEPLHVSAVERQGLPPYEDSGRLYRLEGEGCGSLDVGETLTLRRPGEKRGLGTLKVSAVRAGYALATLLVTGETYPLKGDVAVRQEKLLLLPALPERLQEMPASGLELKAPQVTEVPGPPPSLSPEPVAASRREPIYFLRGDARLSPGALRKLQAWVEAWGKTGPWFIAVPSRPGQDPETVKARVDALKGELARLGVERVQDRSMPPEPSGEFEAVYVGKP